MIRNGRHTLIKEEELVPGDIIKVNWGPMNMDVVLLEGNVVCDESSLTGGPRPRFDFP